MKTIVKKLIGRLKQNFLKLNKIFLERVSNYTVLKKDCENIVGMIPTFVREHQLMEKDALKTDSIVFSKDRAMQLHAFLSSYKEKVKNNDTMYILYKVSNLRHRKSYDDLKKIFQKDNFVFIEEENFRNQLINILELSTAKMFAFYVDDMIFIRDIDYSDFLELDTLENVICLSKGKDLDYSQTLDIPLTIPPFNKISDNLYSFRWDYHKGFNDWTYPTGLSGYIYGRREMLVMFKNSMFKAPNSLEALMYGIFKDMFIHRNGVCQEYVSCVCVHANLVQTEWTNNILDTFSIEDLLLKWEEGLKIDLSKFYNIHAKIAQFKTYEFTER